MSEMVRVAGLSDVPEGAALAVKVNGHAVALFNVAGELRAIDNRCPHMGYPLVEAPVFDGVLRCPWHHWRFELSTGGCLTAGGDDVGTFAVEVRDGQIYVSSEPMGAGLAERRERARRDLELGMMETNTFLIAKALCAARALGVSDDETTAAVVDFGLTYRLEGFGPGLVILTCLRNLEPLLADDDRLLALVHGVTHVARDSANRAPRRRLLPLPDRGPIPTSRLTAWFRKMIEDREAAGAERVLLTALAGGAGLVEAAEMLLLAATDHFFLSVGHVLDFTNKGFELLDHLGPDRAAEVLGSLVRPLATARRHDEGAAEWAITVDPLQASFERFAARPDPVPVWRDESLVTVLLEGDVPDIVAALDAAVQAGAGAHALANTLCEAAMWRVARFHLQNENDWDDVLHLVSYCHAVERLAARFGGRPAAEFALLRAVYHGAMYCHFTRFLNIPAVRLPHERRELPSLPTEPEALCARLLHCAEFQQVEEAAAIVWSYLAAGHDEGPLQRTLVQALLREDSVFHTFQMVECGIARQRLTQDRRGLPLVAAARYLTAQRLRRGILWSTRNAQTLARGEGLHT